MSDFALSFDGSQNYVDLGPMGSFGSNLGNGFYCKFLIKTTSTAVGVSGMDYTGTHHNVIQLAFNIGSSSGSGKLRLYITDNNNNWFGNAVNSPTISFNDGSVHTLEFIANIVAKTLIVNIDGVSQTVTNIVNNTLSTFVNFPEAFYIGAQKSDAGVNSFFACILDNFQIGTSSAVLYGNYAMNDGPGATTIIDSSGNGNTGTLNGSPLPTWATGLNSYGNVAGNFTFSSNLKFNSQ